MRQITAALRQEVPPPVQGKRRRAAGFTLIELLVVLVILGLLAAIAAPRAVRYLGGAKSDAAKLQIESLGAALDLYKLDVGRYPTTSEGLEALVEAPSSVERWNGPYTKGNEVPLDPWSQPYEYRFPGDHGPYDLYSLGADKAEGGEAENSDVNSWSGN